MYTPVATSSARTFSPNLSPSHGFTLLEALVVVAIIGVLSSVAYYALQQHARDQATKDAVITVAGRLEEARDQARHDGLPRLVYFAAPGSCTGGRPPALARIVTDRDRSYDESPGDDTKTLALPEGTPCDVNVYGADTEAPFPDETLPPQMAALCPSCNGLALGLGVASVAVGAGGVEVGVGGLSIGVGLPLGGGGAATPAAAPAAGPAYFAGSRLGDLDHGGTFPRDPATGEPSIAFTPQGSVVATSHPNDWGSGAGAVFLTDNAAKVYAVTVAAGGDVDVLTRMPDGGWR